MKVAIVDDSQSSIINLSALIKQFDANIKIKSFNDDGVLLSHDFALYDIIFVNVKPNIIPEEFASKISITSPQASIIYITDDVCKVGRSHVNNSFSILRKPFNQDDLFCELAKAINEKSDYKTLISFLNNGMNRLIDIENIKYFEGDNKRTIIHIADGDTSNCSQKLTRLITQLSTYNFVQVHKSYLVNISYILKVDKTQVHLKDIAAAIPISRAYKQQFNERLCKQCKIININDD